MSSLQFNPSYKDACAELVGLSETVEFPEIVLERLSVLYHKPIKLFCLVGVPDPAVRAPRIEPGLYASDLFVKLLKAIVALDWELVVILLEHAIAPESENESVNLS